MISKAVIAAQYFSSSVMNCIVNSKLQLNAETYLLFAALPFLHSPFDLHVVQTLVGIFKKLWEGGGGDKPITRT